MNKRLYHETRSRDKANKQDRATRPRVKIKRQDQETRPKYYTIPKDQIKDDAK